MALLPLAGFASITITTQPTLNGAQDYNGNAQQAIATAAVATSTNEPVIYYAVTTSSTAPAEDAEDWKQGIANATATNAGTYKVYLMVKAAEEETLRQYVGAFTINRVDPAATAPVAVAAELTYNGLEQTIVATAATTTDGTLTYSLDQQTWTETAPKAKDADTYTLYYKVTGDNNHKNKVFTAADFKTINAKAFNTTGNFTVTRTATSAIYNGASQKCPYSITYTEGTHSETLTLDEDFEVTYSADPIAVAEYTVTAITPTNTNFSGSFTTANLEALAANLSKWNIAKRPITVRALPQTKVYDGNTTVAAVANTNYQIIGVVDGQNVGIPTLVAESANVGEQTITISNLNGDAAVLDNYEVSYQNSTVTITAIKLTISVDQENAYTSVNKGDNAPSLANLQSALVLNATDYVAPTPQPAIVATQAATIKAAIGMTITGVTLEAAANTSGIYPIVLAETDAAVLDNYDITLENGNFTVKGGNIVITTLPKTRKYGEAEFDWATAQKDVDYIVSVNNLDLGVTLSREAGWDVDQYDINAAWDATKVPAYYDGVVVSKGKYSITPATLKVVMNDQTLFIGDKAEDLDQTACTVTGLVKNADQEIDDTAVDQADIFTLGFDGGVALDAQNRLTTATPYNTGIKATLVSGNYVWDAQQVNGKLIVLDPAATIVLNRPLRAAWDPNAGDIAADVIHANASTNKAITFGDFTMYKEKWYALVLPFNTTVAEVSQKFGYAVVDVLKTDNNRNAVTFKLYMQDIAANTPFLIKVNADKNMNTVVFESRNIVEPATAAALVQTDAFGNKFTGTYTAKNSDWLEGQDYLFSVAKDKDTYGHAVNGETAAATSYLNPVSAYITYKNVQNTTSAPIIYIEEPDGQTTAISVVNNQLVEAATDGWYTLNGVKLQGVPTQKGIYINNGKKIVIK